MVEKRAAEIGVRYLCLRRGSNATVDALGTAVLVTLTVVAELDRLFVAVRAHGAEGAAIWIFRPND